MQHNPEIERIVEHSIKIAKQLNHIITVTETDDTIKSFYKQTLQRIASGKGAQHGQKLSRSSGYLGSIKETKMNLENIYKKS